MKFLGKKEQFIKILVTFRFRRDFDPAIDQRPRGFAEVSTLRMSSVDTVVHPSSDIKQKEKI